MSKTTYRVREGLVVLLKPGQTFSAGEQVELTPEEFELHQLRVESEEQFQARNPVAVATTTKGSK